MAWRLWRSFYHRVCLYLKEEEEMKKNKRLIKGTWVLIPILMLLTIFMGAPSYGATVDVYLQAGVTTILAGAYGLTPNENILMWGYAQCTDGTFNNCQPVSVPGPPLTATEGDTLNIHLKNNLTPVLISGLTPPATLPMVTEPTSIIINGQTPVLTSGTWPTWTDGTIGNRGTDLTKRVRSFTTETSPNGGTNTYTFTLLKAGTYLYQSGTHPSVQVQMGLYGDLKVYPTTAGRAYSDPSTAYSTEVTLLYSEIDPELHYSIASGLYGTPPELPPTPPTRGKMTSTMNYDPQFFLINGEPYTAATAPIPAGPPGQVLLRFLNAGLQTKVPQLINFYMTVIAEDGNPFTYSKQQYSMLLSAGKTMDAIITTTAAGNIPVYDRALNLTNKATSPGGALRYLQVGALVNNPPTITSTPVLTATVGVLYNYDVNATDPNGDTLTYSLTTFPTGMTINSTTGLIAWTPTAGQAPSQAVTVRVTDPGGLFATQSFTITVQAAPTIHIGDLDGTSANLPAPPANRWRATVTATVHDQNHALVSGATVTGTWSTGDTNGRTLSCTTATTGPSIGTCPLTSGRINTNTANVTFTVTNVTKTGATYLSSANHDPDSGAQASNGTSFTVPRP